MFSFQFFFSEISKTITIFKPHIKIKWWREYLCTRTFSVPRKQMFQIYLLRTHPRFFSTDWSLYFSQSLRYPFGRDYSVTPIPLRQVRKLNELLPRRQQFDRAVFQAQSRKMSYHPCPGEVFIKKWRKTTYRWAMEAWCSHHYSPTQIQRTKSVREWLALYSYPNLLSQPCLTWRHYQQR